MGRKIGIGTVGYGMIAKVHLIGIQANAVLFGDGPTAYPRALCTRSAAGKKGLVYEAVYEDLAEMLADEAVEVCDICTPNFLHFEQAMQCLSAGRAVYIEKPLTSGEAEAEQLCAEAEKRGLPNQVALMYRFTPAVARTKDLLDAGAIGEVIHFSGRFFHHAYLDPDRPTSWRQQFALAGGGAVMDLGIHLLDIMLYLLGGAKAVRAVSRTVNEVRYTDATRTATVPNDTDEYLCAMLELESGAVGVIESSRISDSSGSERWLEIFGTGGSLLLDYGAGTVHHVPAGGSPRELTCGDGPCETELLRMFPYGRQTMELRMDAHAAAIQNICYWQAGQKPYSGTPDFAQALRAQRLVHACLAAAQNGQSVAL